MITPTEEEKEFIELFRRLTEEQQSVIYNKIMRLGGLYDAIEILKKAQEEILNEQ